MRRPRACSGGQPKARGRRKRGQERGRPQRRARRGRGGPTHTTQNTRDGNREQPREPRREDGEEADETEMSAATDARPMSGITIARHVPMEPSSQRQGLVKDPGPNASGIDSRVERFQTPPCLPWEATRRALRRGTVGRERVRTWNQRRTEQEPRGIESTLGARPSQPQGGPERGKIRPN